MYLFFDTESAGKPRSWKAPATDTFNWPRMVQIAWLLYDKDRILIEKQLFTIQPEGYEIPYEVERLHGISTDKAREEGVPLKEALTAFLAVLEKADYLIAHNLNLHTHVLGAELYRKSMDHQKLQRPEQYCTMQEGTYFCKLPGKGGRFKWPTLMELHIKLFQARYKRESAITDVAVGALCFFKLVDIEAIDIF
ncbi:MAG: 3'-5' exonuclease [Bacteroidota bacterium]